MIKRIEIGKITNLSLYADPKAYWMIIRKYIYEFTYYYNQSYRRNYYTFY